MKKLIWSQISNQHFQSRRLELGYPDEVFLHYHDFHEFFIIEKGVVFHHINRKNVEIKEGEGWWILPSDVHRISVAKNQSAIIFNFSFPVKYYSAFLKIDPDLIRSLQHPKRRGKPISFSLPAQSRLIQLLMESRNVSNTALQLYRLLGEILTLIDSGKKIETYFPPYMSFNMASRNNRTPQWLQLLLENLEKPEYFLQDVTEIQKKSGYSPSRFSQLFKTYVASTPTNYFNKKRILYAKQMLEETDRPIHSIIKETQFKNVSYFYRVFKFHFGILPGKIRKRNVNLMK